MVIHVCHILHYLRKVAYFGIVPRFMPSVPRRSRCTLRSPPAIELRSLSSPVIEASAVGWARVVEVDSTH